jgi:hypothetical protein
VEIDFQAASVWGISDVKESDDESRMPVLESADKYRL